MEKPVIGTPIGGNKTILAIGGLGASTVEEWESTIERLLFDKDTYDQMVKKIKEEFVERYSYPQNYTIIKNIFDHKY